MMTSKVGMSKSEHCLFSLFLYPIYVVHDTLYHGTLTHASLGLQSPPIQSSTTSNVILPSSSPPRRNF